MPKKYLSNVNAGVACFVLIVWANMASAQENEWNTWTSLELNKKIKKKLELSLSPEVRFTNQFSVDEYFLEAGLEYKLFDFLKVGAKYRYLVNERETKSTEYFRRIALDLKGNYEFKRFDFQLRTRYTNYNELETDNDSKDNYLRYRLKAEYNIKKSKIAPNIGIEFFQLLKDNDFDKVRYFIGASYKINKHHKVEINYLLQNYRDEDYRKNIIAIGYKFSF